LVEGAKKHLDMVLLGSHVTSTHILGTCRLNSNPSINITLQLSGRCIPLFFFLLFTFKVISELLWSCFLNVQVMSGICLSCLRFTKIEVSKTCCHSVQIVLTLRWLYNWRIIKEICSLLPWVAKTKIITLLLSSSKHTEIVIWTRSRRLILGITRICKIIHGTCIKTIEKIRILLRWWLWTSTISENVKEVRTLNICGRSLLRLVLGYWSWVWISK